MDSPVSGSEHEKLKEALKLVVRLLYHSHRNVEKKKNIETYLSYLTELVNTNKQRNEEPKDGARSLDDMYLEVVTKNHISSVGSQFQKNITIDEEPFHIETEAPCDLEAQPPPSRPPPQPQSVALGQALAPFVINTQAPCDIEAQPRPPPQPLSMALVQALAPFVINTQAPCDMPEPQPSPKIPNVKIHATITDATITDATIIYIFIGETIQLHLTLEDATRGRLIEVNEDGNQKKLIKDNISPPKETVPVSPKETTIYELMAWNKDGHKASATTTITVVDIPTPPPDLDPTAAIDASPESIYLGRSVTLTPTFDNGEAKIIIEPSGGTIAELTTLTSGVSFQVEPKVDTRYRLVVTNYSNKTKEESVYITVNPEPEFLTPRFPPSPLPPPPPPPSPRLPELTAKLRTENGNEHIHEGTSVKLIPEFAYGTATIYANDAPLHNADGDMLRSGSAISVKPKKNTTYTLRVTRGREEKNFGLYIRVDPREIQDNTNITANILLVNSGDPVILTPTFTPPGEPKIYETKELNGTETTQELQGPIITGQVIEVRPQVTTTYLLRVTYSRSTSKGRTIKHQESSIVTVNIKKPLIQQQATEFVINMPVPCY